MGSGCWSGYYLLQKKIVCWPFYLYIWNSLWDRVQVDDSFSVIYFKITYPYGAAAPAAQKVIVMLIPIHHSPRTPKRLLYSLETYQCPQMPWATDWIGEPVPNGSDSSKDADVGRLFCAPPALLELKEKGNPLVMDIRCSILHYFRTLHSLALIVCKSFMAEKNSCVSVLPVNPELLAERRRRNWKTVGQLTDTGPTMRH